MPKKSVFSWTKQLWRKHKFQNVNKLSSNIFLTSATTYFWLEFVRRGGGIGARFVGWLFWTEIGGNEICFLARGGAGGRFRSDDDEIFERVSSLELLVLTTKGFFSVLWRFFTFT